jgi:hypothetical protein
MKNSQKTKTNFNSKTKTSKQQQKNQLATALKKNLLRRKQTEINQPK